MRLRMLCRVPIRSTGAAVLGTRSQCIGIGQIRPPRESRTVGPIEMPFGTFDYLGDFTKFPNFHRASPIGRGPTKGRSTQAYYCRFLRFYYACCYLFFLELVYRSESARDSNFSRPNGAIPLVHVPFLWYSRHEFII